MKLWAGKASESSELSGLFCGSLDDRNVERNTNITELWLVLLQREAKTVLSRQPRLRLELAAKL